MSLLAEYMEPCQRIDETTRPDEYGGSKTAWVRGAGFMAAITLDTSLAARRAEKEGVKNIYTVTTQRSTSLLFGDYIQRLSDEKIFKITSDGPDKKSPLSSSLDMRVVSAEEVKSLPGGIENG